MCIVYCQRIVCVVCPLVSGKFYRIQGTAHQYSTHIICYSCGTAVKLSLCFNANASMYNLVHTHKCAVCFPHDLNPCEFLHITLVWRRVLWLQTHGVVVVLPVVVLVLCEVGSVCAVAVGAFAVVVRDIVNPNVGYWRRSRVRPHHGVVVGEVRGRSDASG